MGVKFVVAYGWLVGLFVNGPSHIKCEMAVRYESRWPGTFHPESHEIEVKFVNPKLVKIGCSRRNESEVSELTDSGTKFDDTMNALPFVFAV